MFLKKVYILFQKESVAVLPNGNFRTAGEKVSMKISSKLDRRKNAMRGKPAPTTKYFVFNILSENLHFLTYILYALHNFNFYLR